MKLLILIFLLFSNIIFSQDKFDYFDIDMEMRGRENYRQIKCDSLYYSEDIDSITIFETINSLKTNKKFKSKDGSKYFKIKENEKKHLISELEKLKTFKWKNNLFPRSKAVKILDFQKVLKKTNNLTTDEERKMCSIIYSFSKPIYFRNNKFALILYQENYSDYASISFNIYKVSERHLPLEEYVTIYYINRDSEYR